MAKKKSKTSIVDELLESSVESQWCTVDTENKFVFDTNEYIIDESVKQYKVLNKAGVKNNDWTNESLMTRILYVDTNEEIRFFDENLVEVNSDLVRYVK